MNLLLKIVGVMLLIIALPLLIALFIRKDYTIQREIVVDRPNEAVFDYLRLLRNGDQYNVWVRKDTAMKKSFRGTDGMVGFVYAWEGNRDAGKGEQEITSIREGERIDVEIRFEKPFRNTAQAPMLTRAQGANSTLVTWRMEGRNPYPMNLMNLFIDGMLGKDMEASLQELKGIVESKASAARVHQ